MIALRISGISRSTWLAERVAPGGLVVATDLETDFLESAAPGYPTLKVLTHDITAEDPPTGFDFVHARWLVEWLPDKRLALGRMVSALRPGGTLLIEEPDFVTIYGSGDSIAVRHVFIEAMRHLESTCPIDCEYGRRAMGDLVAVGLEDVQAEGRCPVVLGGTPLATGFLRLTVEKLREPVLAAGEVSPAEFAQALADLQDPSVTVVAPMTVAAWGMRP
ncbi:MAG TPA: methyltransferase domain-containing protein [Streptosporangiaceae bacterium]